MLSRRFAPRLLKTLVEKAGVELPIGNLIVILLFRVGLCEPESPDGLWVWHVDEDVGVDLAEDEGDVVAEADLAPPHGLHRGRAELVVVWNKHSTLLLLVICIKVLKSAVESTCNFDHFHLVLRQILIKYLC